MDNTLIEENHLKNHAANSIRVVLFGLCLGLGYFIFSLLSVSSILGAVMLGIGFYVLAYSFVLSLRGETDGATVVVVGDHDYLEGAQFQPEPNLILESEELGLEEDEEEVSAEVDVLYGVDEETIAAGLDGVVQEEGGLGNLLVNLLEKQGLEIVHDNRLSERNFEFLARRQGVDFAVRVLPGRGMLSLQQVESAIHDRVFTNCAGLMLASLGTFSSPAKRLAESRNIKLADKDILSQWVGGRFN